ncbi:aldehyde dehydrogenase family protein [Streptomyces sp. ISL-10]|uniref:aldehyde dehydrogenase family protein n=1 Tax=Streptomyces sp. ISL-10 TaxID=2819172 RepID=UPI001BECA418|nr:aldehyde dehydrogenase family protein [Streptomyces sp. ISL-10]MBT2363978.1 aldehyde dehydrogenase family protein [Streptomyces sp. ISL-10]
MPVVTLDPDDLPPAGRRSPMSTEAPQPVRPGVFHDGAWRYGELAREVRSPYDGRLVAVVSHASAETVSQERRPVRGLAAADRSRILHACAKGLEARRVDLATCISAEIGMPVTDAEKEVDRSVRWLSLAAEAVPHFGGTSTVLSGPDGDRLAVTTPQPFRRVLAITPYNRPLAQLIVKVAPAMLAGTPIVLKPSERASASAVLAVEVLLESGYPPEYISLWTGGPEVAQALLADTGIGFVAFTGSERSAWAVAAAAGPRPGCYELGDVGALVVCADADLAAAARAAAQGAFSNAGQSCRGVKRVLVADSVVDEFAQLLVGETAAWQVGDPSARTTRIGTLIDSAAVERVRSAVGAAVQGGARVVAGGGHRGAQYWPTVITHVDPGAQLVTEEFLAPVAPVVAMEDALLDELPALYSGGLQVGVFTRDFQRSMNLAQKLPVGTVIVNDGPQYDHPLAPFGGVGHSGHGREGVLASARNMSFSKTIVFPATTEGPR